MKHILSLIEDYGKMKGVCFVIKTLAFPTIVSAVTLIISGFPKLSLCWCETQGMFVSVLGMLLGFMISSTAIVVTSNNENVKKSKDFKINVTSRGREKYLYDELIAESVWTTISCAVSVIVLTIAPLVLDADGGMMLAGIWLTVYCIRCAAGMVLDMYMIFSAPKNQ